MTRRRRILVTCESASMGHVARALVIASALDPLEFEVTFATEPRLRELVEALPGVRFQPLAGIAADRFIRMADRGSFALRPRGLQREVGHDLKVFELVQPDLLINDFRTSIAISAEIAGVRSVAVVNAHWSPFRNLPFDAQAPLAPPSRLDRIRRVLSPAGSASATACVNQVRKRWGLGPVPGYLALLTHSDHVLYAEPEGFVPMHALPDNHAFLGAVHWSPRGATPEWWDAVREDHPLVFVTLGSTGAAARLPVLVRALAGLPVTVAVATAGRIQIPNPPPNVLVADYLPGAEVAKRASLVVCHGGSGVAYQALQAGVPVLSLWSNIDQYLTARMIAYRGAGKECRGDLVGEREVQALARQLLEQDSYHSAARSVSRLFQEYHAPSRLAGFVRRLG